MDNIPEFMSIGEFQAFTGISRWCLQRVIDRHHLTLHPGRGRSLLIEVVPTLKVLATVPNIKWMVSDRGLELIRQVQEEEPQNAA